MFKDLEKKRGGFEPPFFIVLVFALWASLSTQVIASENYELGVGDFIRILVHDEADLTLETRLEQKGVVSYPFLGEIQVVGVTVAELASRIDKGLRGDYLIDPEVQVTVLQYRNFYINGEVRTPGGYPYLPGLTVRKATALAGGLTDLASESKMYLIRENSPDQRSKVTMDDIVKPGDIVVVEEGLF